MTEILVEQDLCIQCGACLALCKSARVYAHVDGHVEAIRPEECWQCGHCVAACPTDALRHSAFPLQDCPPLDVQPLPSIDALVTAFRERRSARIYEDRPVSRDLVEQLVDVARWVPSAGNGQPIDWLAFDDRERIAALSAQTVTVLAYTSRLVRDPAYRSLLVTAQGVEQVRRRLQSADSFERMASRHKAGEDPIFHHAPVLLIAHTTAPSNFGRDDATYAAYNLMLAAERLGLGTCQIGYFQIALALSKELRRDLGLPESRKAEITLTLGYPAYEFHRLIPRRHPELAWNPNSNQGFTPGP